MPDIHQKGQAFLAKASANIALVKYWGKSEAATNLPAVESLSVTLAGLDTVTSVEPIRKSACIASGDIVLQDEKPMLEEDAKRVKLFIDLFRQKYSDNTEFYVRTANHFPTGAGLASSASGFAALGAALAGFYGMKADNLDILVNLVRQGSGSAPRSLLGGFVHLQRGTNTIKLASVKSDLEDSLAVLVCITDAQRKKMSSRAAMAHCQQTSPYWDAWLEIQPRHLQEALAAVQTGDLETMGIVAEQNAQCMHSTCHTARPPVMYWNAATVELLQYIQGLRGDGIQVYATMDAGPQVKLLLNRQDVEKVRTMVSTKIPALRTIVAYPGPGAFV